MNVWDHKTDWHFEENEPNSVYFSAQGFSPAGLRVHVQLSWNEHAEGQVFLPIHQETAEGVQLFAPCPTIRTSALARRTSLIRIKSCGFCDVSPWFCPGTQSKAIWAGLVQFVYDMKLAQPSAKNRFWLLLVFNMWKVFSLLKSSLSHSILLLCLRP